MPDHEMDRWGGTKAFFLFSICRSLPISFRAEWKGDVVVVANKVSSPNGTLFL